MKKFKMSCSKYEDKRIAIQLENGRTLLEFTPLDEETNIFAEIRAWKDDAVMGRCIIEPDVSDQNNGTRLSFVIPQNLIASSRTNHLFITCVATEIESDLRSLLFQGIVEVVN